MGTNLLLELGARCVVIEKLPVEKLSSDELLDLLQLHCIGLGFLMASASVFGPKLEPDSEEIPRLFSATLKERIAQLEKKGDNND